MFSGSASWRLCVFQVKEMIIGIDGRPTERSASRNRGIGMYTRRLCEALFARNGALGYPHRFVVAVSERAEGGSGRAGRLVGSRQEAVGRQREGNGRAGEWEDGRAGVGERESGRAGEWENGRVGEWESGRGRESESVMIAKMRAIRRPSRLQWMMDRWTLPRFLREHQIDIFHATDFTSIPSSPRAKVIAHVHDMIPFVFWKEYSARMPADFRWALQRARQRMHRADRIITDSQHSKQDIVEMTGYPQNRIHVVYFGPSFGKRIAECGLRNEQQIESQVEGQQIENDGSQDEGQQVEKNASQVAGRRSQVQGQQVSGSTGQQVEENESQVAGRRSQVQGRQVSRSTGQQVSSPQSAIRNPQLEDPQSEIRNPQSEDPPLPPFFAHQHGESYPYFLYVGGTDFRKNVPFLIRAFDIFSQKHSDAKLILVGETFLMRKLPEVAEIYRGLEQRGLNNRVQATGFVNEKLLRLLYRRAVALVFPSLYEGFGVPVLEAMTLGTAVLAARTSSIPEILGDTGFYFDPRREDSLVEAMETAYGDASLRRDLSARAQERARQFSWERAAEQIFGIYEEL